MNLIPKKFYLDDVFDDFMLDEPKDNMKCDIYEKDNKYHIEMDVPGFDKKDIKIEADNDYLTITASKDKETKDESKKYLRRERYSTKYQRSFYLGDALTDDIDADFKNGTLSIVIPKKELTNSKKTIEIK